MQDHVTSVQAMRSNCVGEVSRLNLDGQKAVLIYQNSSHLHRKTERNLHLTLIFLVLTATKFCDLECLCCLYFLFISQRLGTWLNCNGHFEG